MIGLYIHQDTFLHRLRPSIKLLFLAVCGTTLFMVSSVTVLSLFLLFVALLYRVAKIPFNNIVKQLKSMSLFLILIFVFQVFVRVGLRVLRLYYALLFFFLYHHLFHSRQKFQIWLTRFKQGFSIFVVLV